MTRTGQLRLRRLPTWHPDPPTLSRCCYACKRYGNLRRPIFTGRDTRQLMTNEVSLEQMLCFLTFQLFESLKVWRGINVDIWENRDDGISRVDIFYYSMNNLWLFFFLRRDKCGYLKMFEKINFSNEKALILIFKCRWDTFADSKVIGISNRLKFCKESS